MKNLGKRLKTLRNERGLTLAQLGQQVDLSASYLSQIERSVTTPSLSKLTTIAKALDVEMGYFFEEDAPSPCIVRLNEGQALNDTSDANVELLSAHPGDKQRPLKIQPYRVIYQPGASRERPPARSEEEFGFVLKGQLTVTVGEETFVLDAGDSIHYQALQPRSWRNEGDEECIAIWTISPPVSEVELEE